MGASHPGLLYCPGRSGLHRAAPEIKLVAALGTVVCVVATPREVFWAFGAYLGLVLLMAKIADVRMRWLAPRMVIELPFVFLAVLLPFTVGGRQVMALGIGLSAEGLLAGWNIIAKGTLGVGTSLLLAATTTPNELVRGLRRLRVPPLVIMIMSLMLRYADVVVAEAKRMRLARIARGDNPGFLWQTGATARGLASLFVRSYERGERVHLAMISRGWTGSLPTSDSRRASWMSWSVGLMPALMSAGVLGAALWNT